MNFAEIINKSQTKKSLRKDEIFWLVDQFTKDKIPDYQMSTWLATVFLNHLSDQETSWLTQALSQSGQQLYWPWPTVDKHSTGGVGDKTSLIIAPLVASMGLKVPMMAGRGLGHTGGTIDKLESIHVRTSYEVAQFKELVEKQNVCIMGQSHDFCPADKRLYALRDATHTVANIPLICSSIMSKKIAEGLRALVLDIKFGSGAFMETLDQAENLARRLISIGFNNDIRTFGILTSMDQPLGRYIGNKLEVLECVEILKDPELGLSKYHDTTILSVLLSALMVYSLDPKSNLDEVFNKTFDHFLSGLAHEKFLEIVKDQQGDLKDLQNIRAKRITVKSDFDGFMNYVDVKSLGFAAVALGAGRFTKEDLIDPDVGFYCHKKDGDPVKKSEAIFDVYYNDEDRLRLCLEKLMMSFRIEIKKGEKKFRFIEKILSFNGSEFCAVKLKTEFFEV